MSGLEFDRSAVALVTGASRGIGRACALKLARHGVPVAINYRQSAAEAAELVARIEREGGCARAFQADISSSEEAAELVDRVEGELGPLGILVNNAGITRDRLLVQMSPDDWGATWCTDLAGARAAAQRALTSMQ